MGERLSIVKRTPTVVLDWWASLGGGAPVLQAAYPQARRLALEPVRAAAAAPAATPWWSPKRWAREPEAAVPQDDLPDGQAQLLWANMMLQASTDPIQTMRRWHRALAVDGFLMFSTLGPGTLPELRSLYARSGWGPPFAPLVDMHDLGDMLVAAGFADPVMDQETVVLTWADAGSALSELRSLGANVDPDRLPGLRTPRWQRRLEAALQADAAARGEARVALSFEIVYGHAFKPVPRAKVASETRVGVEDLRTMARSARRG